MSSVRKRYVQRGQLWVPEYTAHSRGLGDWVARGLAKLGIEQDPGCGCPKRQAALNAMLPFRRRPYQAPAFMRSRPAIAGGSGTADIFFNSVECPHVGGVPTNPNHLFCDDFDHGFWYQAGPPPLIWTNRPNDANARGWLWTNSDNPSGTPPGNPGSLVYPDQAISSSGQGVLGSAFAAKVTSTGASQGGSAPAAQHGFYPLCSGSSITAPKGCASGRSTYQEVYFRWYWKFLPGYVPHGSQKVLTWNRVHDGAGIDYGGGPTRSTWNFSATPTCDCNQEDPARGGAPYINPAAGQWCDLPMNVSPISIQTGRWYYCEVQIKLNTYCTTPPAGNASHPCRNGIWRVWVNDCGVNGDQCGAGTPNPTPTLRSSYTNIAWQGVYPNGQEPNPGLVGGGGLLGTVWWDDWGGSGAELSDSGTFLHDLNVASRAPIGFTGAPIAPPPPGAFNILSTQGNYNLTGATTTLTQTAGPTLVGFVKRH